MWPTHLNAIIEPPALLQLCADPGPKAGVDSKLTTIESHSASEGESDASAGAAVHITLIFLIAYERCELWKETGRKTRSLPLARQTD
jgi:hypothetical protein